MASKTVISKENESNDNKDNFDQNKTTQNAASITCKDSFKLDYLIRSKMIQKLNELNDQIKSNNSIDKDQIHKLTLENEQLIVSLDNLPAVFDEKSDRSNKLAKSKLDHFIIKRLLKIIYFKYFF